jgi:hypothetical protein
MIHDKASEQHNGCTSRKRPGRIYRDEKGSTSTCPHHSYNRVTASDDHLIISKRCGFLRIKIVMIKKMLVAVVAEVRTELDKRIRGYSRRASGMRIWFLGEVGGTSLGRTSP